MDWRRFGTSRTLGGLVKKGGGSRGVIAGGVRGWSLPKEVGRGGLPELQPGRRGTRQAGASRESQAADRKRDHVNASRQRLRPWIQCRPVWAAFATIASTCPTAAVETRSRTARSSRATDEGCRPSRSKIGGQASSMTPRLPATTCRPVQSRDCEQTTHESPYCRPGGEVPIISLSALLSLVRWLDVHVATRKQGGIACEHPRPGAISPNGGHPRGPQDPSARQPVGRPTGGVEAQDSANAGSDPQAARVLSDAEGGDA